MFALNDAADSFRPWRKRPEPLDFASHTLYVSTESCLELEPLRITSNSLSTTHSSLAKNKYYPDGLSTQVPEPRRVPPLPKTENPMRRGTSTMFVMSEDRRRLYQ
jgi:hypothetical protein